MQYFHTTIINVVSLHKHIIIITHEITKLLYIKLKKNSHNKKTKRNFDRTLKMHHPFNQR